MTDKVVTLVPGSGRRSTQGQTGQVLPFTGVHADRLDAYLGEPEPHVSCEPLDAVALLDCDFPLDLKHA
ncbi:MAG TPA: hypothetical protein VHD55_03005 [Candidatus Paceibacterota bacterium]|nr:hypothetical protein [Candidatus Paceibacterota bacterium]